MVSILSLTMTPFEPEICPGKSVISKAQYFESWDHAVEVFGKNQVDSFILMGFGEDLDQFKIDLEEITQHGVIPYLTPARNILSWVKKLLLQIPSCFRIIDVCG